MQNIKLTATGTTPTLAGTPTTLTGFTYVAGGGPSTSQSFNLSGSNLTAGGGTITVTGSTNYEVSADNTTFGTTAMVAYTGTNLAATAVYVRLKAGLAVASYNTEAITAAGGGATSTTVVTASGSVTATPTLTVTPTSLPAFSTTQGTASPAQTYNLTGAALTSAVTVTAPAGYEVAQGVGTSTTAPSTYAATQTVTAANATATHGRTIYVRLAAATAAGTYSGNVTNAATGATTQNVAVTGTVNAPGPVLTPNPAALTGFTYVVGGGPSASQNFGLTGSNLTGAPGNITITGSTDYEVSSDNTNFGGTATVPYTSATLASVPVYVRLKTGLAIGTYNGETIGIAGGGTTSSLTASGSVTAAPTITTTGVTPNAVAAGSTITVTYTTTGTFGTGNTFTVELSTATGTYPGTTLATTTSGTGTITATVPAATTPGTGYTVRVNASNPATMGGTPQALTVTTGPLLNYSFTTANAAGVSSNTNVSGTAVTASSDLTFVNNTPDFRYSGFPQTTTLASLTKGYYEFRVTVAAGSTANLTSITLTDRISNTGPDTYELRTNLDNYQNKVGATQTPNGTGNAFGTTKTISFNATPALATASGLVIFRLYAYDAGGSGGTFAIDDLNLYGTVAATPLPTPTITSFTPTSGLPGTTVTINGTNFTNGATVSFNGTAATTVTFVNAGQLTAVVPTGATTGIISVTTATGTATSTTNFTVLISSPAGLLTLEDDFDYPTGDLLTDHNWVANPIGGSTFSPIAVANGNQTLTTYPVGYGHTVTGSAAYTGTGQDVYRTAALPSGTGTFYTSAIINLSAAQATGDYFLHLLDNTTLAGQAVYRGKVFAQASGAGYQLGLSLQSNAAAAVYGTQVYDFGTAYQVVIKYVQNTATGQDDAVSLFVFSDGNAAPLIEPTPTIGPLTEAVADAPGLNAVALRQGDTGPTLTLDGVRVATGWGSAIGRVVYQTAGNTVAAGSYYSLRVAGTGSQVATNGAVVLEKTLNLDGGQVTTTTTNSLVLRDRSTIAGTPFTDNFEILANGGTSYVDGPVGREAVGGPSLAFPVGRNGNYRPLTLNISRAPAGTTIYTGVQTDASAYTADAVVNAPLTRVSRVRYFGVTANPNPATGLFQGTIGLTFGSDDKVIDPSLASFVVAKSDNAGWNNIGRGANTGAPNNGAFVSGTLTSGPFQDFSNFTLASTAADQSANPLPVQLTSLTATRAAAGVQVAWATASEMNSAKFVVERSFDGSTFESVATVAAQGNSTVAHSYGSLDRSAPAARLYYRLRQVDMDGTTAYSPTVAVAGTAGATSELALYPNPARATLTLLTEQPTAYTVRTALGQPVLSGTTAAGTTTVPVAGLPSGVYFFELYTSTGRVVRRFTKE